jgi:gliding motility-associated-like protein
MNLKFRKRYNLKRWLNKLTLAVIITLLPTLQYAQTNPALDIYKMIDVDSPLPDSLFLIDIYKYIEDTLFFGGGKLSDPLYYGNPKGVGLFRDGLDLGIANGMIISNGYVGTTVIVDGGDNKTGAQALPMYDSLGPYIATPNGPPTLKDSDMDWLAGMFTPGDPKPDTAVDPSYIIFKFKPYYNTIKLDYVFASEEYKYEQPAFPPPPPPPIDVDLTGEDVSDFMAIFIKKFPSEQNYDMIASMIGQDGTPSWVPVCVKTLNHTTPPGYYQPNYDRSFIFDGASTPRSIFPFVNSGGDVVPCTTYWIKIAVADYPNGIVQQGYNLSHQINSAVFLKAYSLMSAYGLEWTVESAITNNDFASDTTLVEGGCSEIAITIKMSVMPRDTTFLRMRIDNAISSEYIITPPLFQDSLIMIPDSVMEYNMVVTAVDDNINEGTNGREPWYIRYTLDPCDVPTADTSGIGQAIAGYTGLIKVYVQDYNPYVNTHKDYGPNPPNIYHCGNDITVSISDILDGGIPPYTYSWSNPPQIGNAETFTTTIKDSPDYAVCTIFDRCTGKPGYVAGKDSAIIYSTLVVQASPDFQLCQNGESDIMVESTNVGNDFTTIWYFQGNPVGYDSIYTVTWDEYGSYAPNTITFTCVVTDECGNTDSDVVNATFFPVVEITGVPLICLYDEIHLQCSPAQSYQWYYNSYPGTPIPGAINQNLYYTPPSAGFHTICVSIINECGEQADTCYTFEVSELIMDMTMNNSTNFNTCPNVPFTLKELHAYDGWEWTWEDNGTNYTATGQTINLELTEAGNHPVTVIAYNIYGCYDTITRNVNVYPYAYPEASTSIASVCIDYPTDLSIVPTGPVSITNYSWTANPPDASLAGQQNTASPTVTPQVTTTYMCKITDNHGCLDSAYVTVNVRPRLAGNILGDPGFQCTDKPVTITFQPIVNPLPAATYAWTFDDGVPAVSNQAIPPQIVWSTPGLKDISLHIEELGCEETFTFQYQVYPDPLAAFSASGNFGCQPIEVSFQNASSNLENPSYLWDFGDGSTGTDANPTHMYPVPGIYDITLTVTNSTGCINTLTISDLVEVYEVPVADFEADPQAATIDNPTIKFTEMINIPFALIKWDFGDSSNVSTEPNPRHTYGAPGSYLVVVYTETEHGCWDRDTLEIGIVEDIKIFVPNAFTPNGDGLNDCFMIGGTTGDIVDLFRIIIFNRWGTEIIDRPITDPNCIWDGKDMSGNVMPGDTYVFRIFGKNFRGAKKVYEGMVMLVK